MGLDAVVYVNKANLPVDQHDRIFQIDEETGEVYVDLEHKEKYPQEMFTAIHRRLGNISLIAELAYEIAGMLSSDSVLINKVMNSASHSGDKIPLQDVGRLESEINLIKRDSGHSRSTELGYLLEALEELVEAAKKQRNPIVFV